MLQIIIKIMQRYKLLFLFLFLFVNSLAQETAIKYLKIKSLDTNNINKESFNLNRIQPIGLTNKVQKSFFDYNLDFDINSSKQEIDITNKTEVDQTVKQFSPHVIINCAAMTNVDACELSQKQCWDINVNGVKYLTNAGAKLGSHFIHLSTDFVFDGEDGPYNESDTPNPLHYYAKSKLESEKIVIENCVN